jgi:hypothetical protein
MFAVLGLDADEWAIIQPQPATWGTISIPERTIYAGPEYHNLPHLRTGSSNPYDIKGQCGSTSNCSSTK